MTSKKAAAVTPGGLKLSSPFGKAMVSFIEAPSQRDLALEFVAKGRPPMEAIDPALQAEFGDTYTTTYEATSQAGYIVARMLKKLGYTKTGSKSLSSDCLVKRGATFAATS